MITRTTWSFTETFYIGCKKYNIDNMELLVPDCIRSIDDPEVVYSLLSAQDLETHDTTYHNSPKHIT